MAELQTLTSTVTVSGDTGLGTGTSTASFDLSTKVSQLPLFCNIQSINLTYSNWTATKSGTFGSISY